MKPLVVSIQQNNLKTNADRDMCEELIYNWWECIWKLVWRLLKKLKIELPCDLAILLPGTYLNTASVQ
jgi:hypothetical protein